MRVDLLLWSGRIGGAETFTVDLCRALRPHGIDPVLTFITTAGDMGERLGRDKVDYRAYGARRGRAVARNPRRLVEFICESAPDVVVTPTMGWLCTVLRGGGYRGTMVAVEHGSSVALGLPEPLLRRQSRRWEAALALSWKPAESVVAVSRTVAEAAEDQWITKRKIPVIYCGVDLERYCSGEVKVSDRRVSRLRLGIVSRIRRGKGIDVAIRAMARLGGSVGQLDVWGAGPEEANLQRLAASLNVADRVVFKGVTQTPESVWQTSDLCLVPTAAGCETFGRTAVEAMAASRPVVASRRGGLTEVVVDGVTGRLVAAGSVSELSDAIRGYANDPLKARIHGANGRLRCEKLFSLDQSARQYSALIQRLNREA